MGGRRVEEAGHTEEIDNQRFTFSRPSLMSQTGPTCPLCGREVTLRSLSLGKLQEKPTVNPQLTAGFVSPYPGLGPGYLGPDQKLSGLDKVSLSLSLFYSLGQPAVPQSTGQII